MRTEQIIRLPHDPYRNRKEAPPPEIRTFSPDHLAHEAALACQMMERWGLVAATPDGEDSAGRAKLRRITGEELAREACDAAAAAYKEFETRGWIVQGKTWAEAQEIVAEQFKKQNGED